MKHAFIYARVSTDEQAKEGQSIETQLRVCRKYASENDLKVVEIFVDEGKSATNMHRPALQDMLGKLQGKGNATSVVLVQDTDRLARNTFDHLKIKSILKKYDVQLIAINQPLIDDSPEGNLIDTMLAATNAFQSQITGRKTSKVLEQKAEIGWFPGGVPPLGYRNADNPAPTSTLDKRRVVVDDSVAPYIKNIFDQYARGDINMNSLADYLNKLGIKSPQSKSVVRHNLVARMLQNPFYIGQFYWKGKLYNGKQETFISKQLYDQVQEVLAMRNQNRSRKRKHNMLLRGFLFYEPSDCQMWGEIKEKGGKQYKHYFCPKTKKGSYTPANEAEALIEKLFKKIEISKDYRQEIVETAKKLLKESRDSRDEERDGLLREKAKYQKAISEAEDDRYIRQNISGEALMRVIDKYKPLLENVDDALDKLDVNHTERLEALERILRLAENIGNAYKKAPPPLKRQYLALFFSKIYIRDKKIVKYDLAPELKEMIEAGSVRVRSKGLPE